MEVRLPHAVHNAKTVTLRHRAEYLAVRLLLGSLRHVPRRVARWVGAATGSLAYRCLARLRRTGERNLEIAFPAMPEDDRRGILKRMYRNLGFQLAEFCQMPTYNQQEMTSFIRYDGLERYEAAKARGKGVFVLTGHLGAWELSSFYHSVRGYPMSLVIRRLDNPLVDAYVNAVRCVHGNRVIHKDEFARGLLSAMHRGETVGVLMDTNMTPPQGVFVPFFGVEACTAAGLARVAAKTGAAVLPGFLLAEGDTGRYVLHFGEEIPVPQTGDIAGDTMRNTATFTATLESYIRRYPEQWLWVHRRWKTRPPGAEAMYS